MGNQSSLVIGKIYKVYDVRNEGFGNNLFLVYAEGWNYFPVHCFEPFE